MSKPIYQTGVFWAKFQSDNKKCNQCDSIIYGDMHVLVVQFDEGDIKETVFTELNIRLCVPCYVSIK